MRPGDPRADPVVVDLIELAGLWIAASDWQALLRTLRRLHDELTRRFPDDRAFAARFEAIAQAVETTNAAPAADDIRRAYRQATVG